MKYLLLTLLLLIPLTAFMASSNLSNVQGTINSSIAFTPATAVAPGVAGVVPAEPTNPTLAYEVLTNQTGGAAWQTAAQLKAAMSFPTPNVVVFTANGTYTPSANIKYAIVEMVGGGGGGGSVSSSGGTQHIGYGGSAGGYVKAYLTAAQIGASQAITVGSGGSAGASGVSTTFGSLLTAAGGNPGGGSGTFGSGALTHGAPSPGVGFTITTGTDLGSSYGDNGDIGIGAIPLGNTAVSGSGGNSVWGVGGRGVNTSGGVANGLAGTGFGSGGSGGLSVASASTGNGGSGAPGKVIITEYF